MNRILTLIVGLLFASTQLHAQQTLPLDRNSPRATITQHLGAFVEISIEYSRPFVNGRTIFGELIPYGVQASPLGPDKTLPWRMGADENTMLTLSHDAVVAGKNIPAGTYSLHAVPDKNEWKIMVNKNISAWGSYFYDPALDVAVLELTPQEVSFTENLTFSFDALTKSSTHLMMKWENTGLTIPIEFDIHTINLDEYDKQLTSLPGFNPQAWVQAAQYTLNHDTLYNRGLFYAQQGLMMSRNRNMNAVITAAQIHEKLEAFNEADILFNQYQEKFSEPQLSAYGNWLMKDGRSDRGLEILSLNTNMNAKSATAHAALAKAYADIGKTKEAKKSYKKAIKYAEGKQKEDFEKALEKL